MDLVGSLQNRVEHLPGDRNEAGVSHPGPVMAVLHLQKLVGTDLLDGCQVRLGVALDRDLGGHSAHGVHAAAVAGPDEKLPAATQERLGHRHLTPVRQDRP